MGRGPRDPGFRKGLGHPVSAPPQRTTPPTFRTQPVRGPPQALPAPPQAAAEAVGQAWRMPRRHSVLLFSSVRVHRMDRFCPRPGRVRGVAWTGCWWTGPAAGPLPAPTGPAAGPPAGAGGPDTGPPTRPAAGPLADRWANRWTPLPAGGTGAATADGTGQPWCVATRARPGGWCRTSCGPGAVGYAAPPPPPAGPGAGRPWSGPARSPPPTAGCWDRSARCGRCGGRPAPSAGVCWSPADPRRGRGR